jgi:hypothetical protein
MAHEEYLDCKFQMENGNNCACQKYIENDEKLKCICGHFMKYHTYKQVNELSAPNAPPNAPPPQLD